jgi:hypothetical protein
MAAVPEHIRTLALSRPWDARRRRPDDVIEQLRKLGIEADSQLATFFREFIAPNLLSSSSLETLMDPASPSPQMGRATSFVREVWELPHEYVCLTSCEGEGCYLYSTRTGAVYDFELRTREEFLANQIAKWRDFNTFIEWYLTPAWKE